MRNLYNGLGMSKAGRQALGLLAMYNGLLVWLETGGICPDSIMPTVLYAKEESGNVIAKWPTTGDDKKHLEFIVPIVTEWEKWLNSNLSSFPALLVISTADHILTDLYEKLAYKKKGVPDRNKLELLEPLLECNKTLMEFVDPQLVAHETFEKSRYMLQKLYKDLGFTPL